MSNRSKRFVLPYEPDYAAHRNDDRTCRVTQLHLRARQQVLGPTIAPELAELGGAELEQTLPHLRLPG